MVFNLPPSSHGTEAGAPAARRPGAAGGRARVGGARDMRKARWLVCCGLLPAALAGGCAGFWDEVTSRDFTVSALFSRPEPLQVLKDSDDGTQRAQALASLEEPLQHGG